MMSETSVYSPWLYKPSIIVDNFLPVISYIAITISDYVGIFTFVLMIELAGLGYILFMVMVMH
ncbi:MAG: hypothetical protein ACUVWP_08515 [bacterium]